MRIASLINDKIAGRRRNERDDSITTVQAEIVLNCGATYEGEVRSCLPAEAIELFAQTDDTFSVYFIDPGSIAVIRFKNA